MDRRQNLLHSAEQIVRQKGYDAFSYADLERAVGIRKASIHYHFASKADLSLAMIRNYSEGLFDQLDQIAEKQPDAGAKLLEFLHIYKDAMIDGRSLCLCVAFSMGRESLPASTQGALQAFHAQMLEWLKAIFREGQIDGSIRNVGDLKLEAAACLALVEGAQLVARSIEDKDHFNTAVSLMIERIAQS